MTANQSSLLREDISDELLASAAWLTFTADHDEEDAAARFQHRYGQPPAHIVDDLRWTVPTLKLGPVPKERQ